MNIFKYLKYYLLLIFFSFANLLSQTQNSEKNIYFGASMLPFSIDDVADIHVSDWQNYGLGSSEGRVSLPLSAGEMSGLQFGGMVGMQDPSWFDGATLFGELHIAPKKGIYIISILGGADIKLNEMESGIVSFRPKIGYTVGIFNFGEVEVLPGKTPPVITPEGTFNEGDNISANIGGFTVDFGIRYLYKTSTSPVGIFGEIGWAQAFIGDLKVQAGEVTLNYDSPTVVKDDYSSTQAGIDPKAKMSGIYFSFGLCLNW